MTLYPFRYLDIRYGFNPHTHEGCDLFIISVYIKMKVSIHTPTKGVTYHDILGRGDSRVSIHTPTKGVTTATQAPSIPGIVSIHTPTKGVTCDLNQKQGAEDVSIHTPTKGVTPFRQSGTTRPRCFNPHTHEGCDPGFCTSLHPKRFQSTHPRRV